MYQKNSAQPLSPDNESVLRDLQWVLTSPPLTGSPLPLLKNAPLDGISRQVLATLAAQRKAPIGRYFEALLAALLGHHPSVLSLRKNLIVYAGKRSVGEADFLIETADETLHLEVALKFYLGTGDRRQSSLWFGPMARDRLDLKLEKFQSQLALFATPEGRELLSSLHLPPPALFPPNARPPLSPFRKPSPRCVAHSAHRKPQSQSRLLASLG